MQNMLQTHHVNTKKTWRITVAKDGKLNRSSANFAKLSWIGYCTSWTAHSFQADNQTTQPHKHFYCVYPAIFGRHAYVAKFWHC